MDNVKGYTLYHVVVEEMVQGQWGEIELSSFTDEGMG